jgi:DNA-binding transcriptional regulator YhcF (GntR family)
VNIEVEPDSPIPPFEQVRRQIATMVRAGVLPAGSRLPPIRQLAGDLGLANGTIARAYRELEAEGLVVSRVRHGTTVAPLPALAPAERHRRLADAARSYVLAARQLGADPQTALDEIRRSFSATPGTGG